MNSDTNMYCQLCSIENLSKAYMKARKGKRTRWYVKEFENDLDKNLLRLSEELRNMTYEPRSMKTFVIRDPKTRVISASAFRDRVVHHALCNTIEPIFDRTFICDSFANRKGKGTHAALKRFDAFMRKVSGNGKPLAYARNGNQVYGYALKADIRHYFDSVDHETMIRIIGRKIGNEKVIWLIKKILGNHASETLGRGMPIGNLTSQFFANVYLNEFDHFVKHELKAKYYIRYVDDFVILDPEKARLKLYKSEIGKFLQTIKLELHQEKSKVMPLSRGVKFLGFRVFYKYKLPSDSNIRKLERRIADYVNAHEMGSMSKVEIIERIHGWSAYAMHADTFNLRRRTMKKLGRLLRNR